MAPGARATDTGPTSTRAGRLRSGSRTAQVRGTPRVPRTVMLSPRSDSVAEWLDHPGTTGRRAANQERRWDPKAGPGESGPAGPAPLEPGPGSSAFLAVPANLWPIALRTGLCLPQSPGAAVPSERAAAAGNVSVRAPSEAYLSRAPSEAGELHCTGRCGFSGRFRGFGGAPNRHPKARPRLPTGPVL